MANTRPCESIYSGTAWPRRLLGSYRSQNAAGKRGSDDRSQDWHPGVRPIRPSLAGYRQQRVRQTRTEVAGGVDRVSRGRTERQPNGPDEASHQKRGQAGNGPRGENQLGSDGPHEDDEHEGRRDFTEEIEAERTNGRRRAENRELRGGILRHLPMRIVEEPDGRRGGKAASHLRQEGRHHLRVIAGL